MNNFKVGQLVRRKIRGAVANTECYLLLNIERINDTAPDYWRVLTPSGELALIVDSMTYYEVVS